MKDLLIIKETVIDIERVRLYLCDERIESTVQFLNGISSYHDQLEDVVRALEDIRVRLIRSANELKTTDANGMSNVLVQLAYLSDSIDALHYVAATGLFKNEEA